MNYGELLKDPRWQKRRLEIFERDDWRCRACNAHDHALNVHHSHYRDDADGPWDYPDTALLTLCERCHEAIHQHGGFPRRPPAAETARVQNPPQIETAYLSLMAAKTPEERRKNLRLLEHRVNDRTQAQISRLEKARGLR